MLIEFRSHGSDRKELSRTSSSSTRYATGPNTIVGMEDDFKTVVDHLTAQTDELTVTPVVGMGSIGKSTLATRVYHDQFTGHRFDTCAWVTVSENYNERQVLLDVVSSIRRINKTDESIKNINSDQLAEIAYRSLKGRRFLIVIDDLWSNEAWDQMQRLFPDDKKKSRILLTTRLKYVADYLDISYNIVKGLPFSITVIAGLLGKVDPTRDNWKKVEENLNSFFGTVSEQCQTILSLSYRYLPQHLKACFLYIGGFPEDMEISVSKLIRLWIAELFVKPRSNKRLEVVAEEYLQDLIDRSLILAGTRRPDGRMKTCKIHDLLRQLCIRESQLDNFMHVLNDNDYTFSKDIDIYPRRVMLSCHVSHPEHGSGTTSTTRSLVFMSFFDKFSRQCPCSIIYNFKLLKVLDFSSIDYDFCRIIPELVHLRYVAANIEEAPSLTKLRNLRTIILRTIEKKDLDLPLEIWTMSDIRHLHLGWSVHMPNPLDAERHGIGEQPLFLNNLQKLALYSSPFEAEILRRTPNLNKLRVTNIDSTQWSDFLDCLFLLQGLETLDIRAEVPHGQHVLHRNIFLPNLKQLRLRFTSLAWEDMVVLANLPNLEVLKAHCGFIGTDWRLNENVVFQRLKYLRLEWEDLERWEAASDNFLMLEQLVLAMLFRLEEIPQSIGEIMTLKLIQIEYCGSTVETSAKKIQQEQESWGNDELQVRIIRGERKEEAEIKQLRRNLNFKATPMPAFYREPGRRSEENKDGQIWEDTGARAVVRGRWRMDRKREILDVLRPKTVFSVLKLAELASKTKSQSRPTTAAGARATSATENTVRCLRAEVYNRCSTNERLNVADSPQVSEVTIHPSTELSNSSVPSAATSKTSKQTESNRTVAPKREQEKRQVANSPRPRTSDSIRRNKDFKAEDKTKVLARRTGNHATRKDVRSMDLSHSTRVGHLAVGVAS
ncbi:hypothetical protein P3L10_003954 [Capsicum annuum]